MFGPNIQGKISGVRTVFPNVNQAYGVGFYAFKATKYSTAPDEQRVDEGSQLGCNAFDIDLDPSLYSGVYSGDTVQPAALSVLPCIRYY